ncbi:type II and III secretion system protein family protein [Roseobacter sp. HKCCA0434]|uniref:type II and III secretion system protein family protein n=1 Tax=Roseobacter sp. HKCCA0434 TaxID=3079297 RepID=UPI0039677352
MSLRKLIRAFVLGGSCMLAVGAAHAQQEPVLTVQRGAVAQAITVPVDQATVLTSRVEISELSLANPRIADVAVLGDSSLYVLGRAPGRTTLTLIGLNNQVVANVEIRVIPDIAEFKERLADILPGENIEVRTAGAGIVLSGTVSGARKVARAMELAQQYAPDNVTNLMMVGGTQQVMLKVRFAEVSRDVSQNLGIGLGITDGGDFVGSFGTDVGGAPLIGSGNLALNANTGGSLGALFQLGDIGIEIALNALESDGLLRTLAEPNLVALSGEGAEFLAGGEFPAPTIDSDGNVIVEFKPFGVGLSFVPTVVDEDLINIQLSASVSSIDPQIVGSTGGGFSVNGLTTRSAQTTVEMRDGQSFAIAGLLQDDYSNSVSQIPILGDIPVLGALFRSTQFVRGQTELVIIITPYLVSPTNGELLALPTDRVGIPNERDLFLLGQVTGEPDAVAAQEFEGDYGYVLE